MANLITKIRTELEHNANSKTKESTKRFFKEEIKTYGVKAATVNKISKKFFKEVEEKKKVRIFSLCEQFWQTGNLEEALIACHWSASIWKQYKPKDFVIFEKWVKKYITNWATCDTFCNHTIGKFIEIYPTYISQLKKWTKSKNKWVKRASAVSLIIPAKNGKFLKDVFEISDSLLLDTDDMVQKGYGWLLKVASQAHQNKVFNYVMKNKSVMPRTSLRYAIEKMPKKLKKQAMAK